MIQKITRIPLRDAFKHEALDFTRWLEENIDVLNDCLDITLSNAEREQAASDFSVDIVCEDESVSKVIRECLTVTGSVSCDYDSTFLVFR